MDYTIASFTHPRMGSPYPSTILVRRIFAKVRTVLLTVSNDIFGNIFLVFLKWRLLKDDPWI